MIQANHALSYRAAARIPQMRAALQLHLVACSICQVCIISLVWYARGRILASEEAILLSIFAFSFIFYFVMGIFVYKRHTRRVIRVAFRADEAIPDASLFGDFPKGEAEQIGRYAIHSYSHLVRLSQSVETCILLALVLGLPLIMAPSSDVLALTVSLGLAHMTLVALWYWVLPEWMISVVASPEGVFYKGVCVEEHVPWSSEKIILADSGVDAYLLLRLGQGRKQSYALVPLSSLDKKQIINLAAG